MCKTSDSLASIGKWFRITKYWKLQNYSRYNSVFIFLQKHIIRNTSLQCQANDNGRKPHTFQFKLAISAFIMKIKQVSDTVSLCLQERKCCAGYYGINCEKCPGPEGQSCFGNGVCVDGINGTGVCQCNQGFNGTACETCQAGKYGIHCDQGIEHLKAHTFKYCTL